VCSLYIIQCFTCLWPSITSNLMESKSDIFQAYLNIVYPLSQTHVGKKVVFFLLFSRSYSHASLFPHLSLSALLFFSLLYSLLSLLISLVALITLLFSFSFLIHSLFSLSSYPSPLFSSLSLPIPSLLHSLLSSTPYSFPTLLALLTLLSLHQSTTSSPPITFSKVHTEKSAGYIFFWMTLICFKLWFGFRCASSSIITLNSHALHHSWPNSIAIHHTQSHSITLNHNNHSIADMWSRP
jgi:hypothetical protein